MDIVMDQISKTKESYLDSDDGVCIIRFFDRNTDNMMGLFQSCVDSIFEITKKQKLNKKSRLLTQDFATGKFWKNQICFLQIKILERLISKSENGRSQFYQFLTEKEESLEDEEQA